MTTTTTPKTVRYTCLTYFCLIFFFQILAPVGIVHFLPSSFVIIFVGYKNR